MFVVVVGNATTYSVGCIMYVYVCVCGYSLGAGRQSVEAAAALYKAALPNLVRIVVGNDLETVVV